MSGPRRIATSGAVAGNGTSDRAGGGNTCGSNSVVVVVNDGGVARSSIFAGVGRLPITTD